MRMSCLPAPRSVSVALCLLVTGVLQGADDDAIARIEGDSQLEVTVGMSGTIGQIVLPGSELTVKEVDPRRTPIAIRIDEVFPHGESFRYDFTWFGLEPGKHDLSDYLARKDGTSAEDLPHIPVTVNSVLPPDELHPNAASSGLLARIGGYRMAMIAATVAWIAGLFAILFVGRAKKRVSAAAVEQQLSPVEQIQRLIDRALAQGTLEPSDKAALDARILGFWRDRRNLGDVKVADALSTLKQDAQAAPLLAGIERWFYSREAPSRDEIAELLRPMAELTKTAAATPSQQPAGQEVG